jgi:hypothetical protein
VERAGQFGRAIEIGARVLAGHSEDRDMIEFGEELTELMEQPPQTLAGLRHLETAFFTYWNESAGPHVDRFWAQVAAEGLPFERKDVLGDVLRRGRINNAGEHEVVVDHLVVAEQEGRITADEAARLSTYIGDYENRASRRARHSAP